MEMFNGKKVLMFLGNNPYPHDARVHPEAMALKKDGYEVTVISPKLRQQPYFERVEGIRAYRYPAPPEIDSVIGYGLEYGVSFLGTLFWTIFVFLRHGFDVIHAHNPPDIFVLIALIFKPIGKKFVFDHHDLSADLYMAKSDGAPNSLILKTLVWFEMMSCKVADLIITTNGSYRRLNIERHGISPEKVKIVRNGANLRRLKIVDPDPRLKQAGKKILGFVGSMGKQDGVEYLLYAVEHLYKKLNRDDFYCIIVGDGGEFENLVALTHALGLETLVTFTGVQDGFELNQSYSTMDICIDPDPYNPFNNHSTMVKMMEYMAFHKPIVAFDLHEHRVTADQAAIYVPGNDFIKMAEVIEQLMDDPELCRKMGEYGRNRIDNALTWAHSQKKLVEAYQYLFPQFKEAKQSSQMADNLVP